MSGIPNYSLYTPPIQAEYIDCGLVVVPVGISMVLSNGQTTMLGLGYEMLKQV